MNDLVDDLAADPDVPPARPAADVVEAGRLMAVLRAGGDVRADLIRRIRRAVRDGSYENDLKLSVAVDRLADQMR